MTVTPGAAASWDPKAFLGRGWAFPVRPAGDDVALVALEDDVRQSVRIILGTGLGERVMRPDFGCVLPELVFEPMSTTTKALVRHGVEEALTAWEPRIDEVRAEVTADPSTPGLLLVEVRYRVRSTNTFYNMVYPFHLREGR